MRSQTITIIFSKVILTVGSKIKSLKIILWNALVQKTKFFWKHYCCKKWKKKKKKHWKIVFNNFQETACEQQAKPVCPKYSVLVGYTAKNNCKKWTCRCPEYGVYFPDLLSCYRVYKQGPCPRNHYVYLARNELEPKCVPNPCKEDGKVLFQNKCYRLYDENERCGRRGMLFVNEETFEIKCVETLPEIVKPYTITCYIDKHGMQRCSAP